MILRAAVISLISAVTFLLSFSVYAQMPDWIFFRDRDGNGYYYDKAFKIRITDENPFEYIPVSSKNADYSLNKGIEFIKAGMYPEGMFYLKSLRSLPADSLRVEKNSREASKWINYLYKKHGDRYAHFDNQSPLLLNLAGENYSLINEKLRYKIVLKKQPRIIRASWKSSGSAYGLKFGFNLDGSDKGDGFDCVVGIESKVLKGNVQEFSDIEDSWRLELGRDNLARVEVLRGEDRVIYSYTYGDGAPFSGVEGIYLNGRYIHIVRVICGNGIRDAVFGEIMKPVENLVLIK